MSSITVLFEKNKSCNCHGLCANGWKHGTPQKNKS